MVGATAVKAPEELASPERPRPAQANSKLEVRDLAAEPEIVQDTLLCLLKTQEDRLALAPEVTQRLLGKVA